MNSIHNHKWHNYCINNSIGNCCDKTYIFVGLHSLCSALVATITKIFAAHVQIMSIIKDLKKKKKDGSTAARK